MKVILLNGVNGAGKTTVMRHYLNNYLGARVGLWEQRWEGFKFYRQSTVGKQIIVFGDYSREGWHLVGADAWPLHRRLYFLRNFDFGHTDGMIMECQLYDSRLRELRETCEDKGYKLFIIRLWAKPDDCVKRLRVQRGKKATKYGLKNLGSRSAKIGFDRWDREISNSVEHERHAASDLDEIVRGIL